MKLIEAHATNYRNIIDADPVKIGQTTCLVGKNEAGKSAFLKALEGIRSTDPDFNEYGKVTNYPRRMLSEYESDYGDGQARVMCTKWKLEPADVAAIATVFGVEALSGGEVTISKSYEQTNTTWDVPFVNEAALDHLVAKHGLTDEDRAVLGSASTTERAAEALESLASRTDPQQGLLDAITKFRKKSASLKAIDILSDRAPKFMYFSHYDRMSGALSIDKLNDDTQNSRPMSSGDRVFLDFLEYAGTTLDDLVKTTQFEELNAKCEAAALKITDQIFDYWTQNDELKIKVVLSEGKSGDPVPFNAGPVARARVENSLHGVTVPFSERSAGFIWFFSFLVKFAQIKKSHGNVIR